MSNFMSCKLRTFLGEPMGEKCVAFVDGVGRDLARSLITCGYDKAYVLLGQFLLMHKKDEEFQMWLRMSFGATRQEARMIANCLREWCNSFI
ncbi:barrier-to-autointegration factor-like protein [Gracilinanus agilis]|uniref:barrier-to-autointegration factor-like protein n=1 Tax=Gracilinanus agilis TaxID=191870 RepID=UPI001CFE58F3|nr:barrier-to-autointegration factor-like protein [Gracilinanus agilis]